MILLPSCPGPNREAAFGGANLNESDIALPTFRRRENHEQNIVLPVHPHISQKLWIDAPDDKTMHFWSRKTKTSVFAPRCPHSGSALGSQEWPQSMRKEMASCPGNTL